MDTCISPVTWQDLRGIRGFLTSVNNTKCPETLAITQAARFTCPASCFAATSGISSGFTLCFF